MVWSWANDQTAGFSYRRQAHEALIHRLDAELAGGERTAIDARLAADGVGEVLGVTDAIGAFLIGLIIGATKYRNRVEQFALPMRDVFGAFFFLNFGLGLNPSLFPSVLGPVAIAVGITVALNVIAGQFVAWLNKLGPQAGINTMLTDMGAFMEELSKSELVATRTAESYDVLDAAGMNYMEARYEIDRELFPRRLRKAVNGPEEEDVIRTGRSAGYALDVEG